ncbi:alpha/beta fold hydrolase [Caulobacter sp. RL271]|jgi:pimeloyl-ACP methyl ester carboxylesterase|uniref:Alpha/beta hydrolase n=1 Tax=Caulobacter segnis TaxID=88688 RepID=A0ABY4ZRJ3_9CAUL|nr:alpha/beta hydrolase [Caulobacter segnis]USQ95422.1 alpha/beta hydrolase [Caulobacter segnis]
MRHWISSAALGAVFLCSAVARAEQPAAPAHAASAFAPTSAQAKLLVKAERAGAQDLSASAAPAGGMILKGTLEGRAFVLAIPATWRGEIMLFGQGYATPGSAPTVPMDLLAKDPGGGLFNHLYDEGVASGVAAFDKSGIATESGAKNTMRLRALAATLGGERFYAVGGSMGGSIVMALIDRYPTAFSGAVAMCGVTQGWRPLIQQLTDMRGAYDILTAGTPYALPGEKDLTRSALPVTPPAGDATPGDAFREAQKMRLLTPIFGLFLAAKANPAGPEARIIQQVAAIGGFTPDPAALGAPLSAAALGMDDIIATMGGLPIGNRARVYAPPEMTPDEAADFNRKMQRYDADAAAVAYARAWHETSGTFEIPLVTAHQTIDALVPFSQSEGLGRVVAEAGNSGRLAQYALEPTRVPLPEGLEGFTHCGFSPGQNIAAFEAMRDWVRSGKKPGADAVR